MSFSIEDLNKLSDKPLEDQPDLDAWEPPKSEYKLPKADRYVMQLADIVQPIEVEGGVMFKLDFQIVDGPAVRFQGPYSSRGWKGGPAKLLDLTMCAGVPVTPPLSTRAWAATLMKLRDSGRKFIGYLDWEGVCLTCRDNILTLETGERDPEIAGREASKEVWTAARAKGRKVKHYAQFPNNGDGEKTQNFDCPDCGTPNGVRAQARITRFYQVSREA